jgi:hypothetical protein
MQWNTSFYPGRVFTRLAVVVEMVVHWTMLVANTTPHPHTHPFLITPTIHTARHQRALFRAESGTP